MIPVLSRLQIVFRSVDKYNSLRQVTNRVTPTTSTEKGNLKHDRQETLQSKRLLCRRLLVLKDWLFSITLSSPRALDTMAPAILSDKTSQQPVAVAPKARDHQVIRTSRPNPSLQVTADHKLKSAEAPVYAPGKGEVLLHIKATGICGSDIHFWKTGRIGTLVFEGDCIIGHEASGIVLQCGEGVDHLKPGKSCYCTKLHSLLMSCTQVTE